MAIPQSNLPNTTLHHHHMTIIPQILVQTPYPKSSNTGHPYIRMTVPLPTMLPHIRPQKATVPGVPSSPTVLWMTGRVEATATLRVQLPLDPPRNAPSPVLHHLPHQKTRKNRRKRRRPAFTTVGGRVTALASVTQASDPLSVPRWTMLRSNCDIKIIPSCPDDGDE